MNSNCLLGVFVLLLASCAIAHPVGNSLPDGFYNIEFFGDKACSSPAKFTYKQLDICAINVNEPEYYESTTCTKKAFETQNDCAKGCTLCGGTTSGPIGCITLSGAYSILRTCGPAPKILYGNTWLLKYKSASANCSSSVLESGTVADSCYPTDFREAVEYQCTASTRTEIKYNNCKFVSCDGCTVQSQTIENDIGQCQDSQTFQCVSL